MNKKISIIQILRLITQITFLILLPGLFTLVFGEIKQLFVMLVNGNADFQQFIPHFIEFILVIPLTILLGRFFCGWFCAFGTYNDLVYLLSKYVFKIKSNINEKLDAVLKYLKYVILAFIIVFIWSGGSSAFDSASPWNAFAQGFNISDAVTQYTIGFILLILITIGDLFVERSFCRYLCPLGAIFSIISKIRIFNIRKPSENCGRCRACTMSCAMGLKLYKTAKVRSGECINCMKCVKACPRKNAQAYLADQKISPALVSAFAIAAFTGFYSISGTVSAMQTGNNMQASSSASGSALLPGNTQQSSDNSGQTKDNTQQTSGASQNRNKKYKDGTYTGVGMGYRPNLEVSVTVKDDVITDVQIVSSNETPRFAMQPFSVIPAEIIKSQSTNVDAVSGATRTSKGIMMAAEDALSQAGIDNSKADSGSN